MSTAGIFDEEEGGTILSQTDGHRPHRMSRSDSDVHKYSALWQVTWERIDCFLPNLKQELFVSRSQSSSRASSPPVPTPEPSPTQSRQPGPRAEEPSAPEGIQDRTSLVWTVFMRLFVGRSEDRGSRQRYFYCES